MDALLCGEDSILKAQLMVAEMYRVLKPGGAFLVCSYGLPATRQAYFEKTGYDWTVSATKIRKFHLFITYLYYLCY